MILVMIVWLRHLLGWLVSAFHSRQDLMLENIALRQQLLSCMLKDLVGDSPLLTSCSGFCCEKPRMEAAAHTAYTTDSCRLASCWVSAVLEMAFPNPIYGRSKAYKPRDSSLDLPEGGPKSDVGSAAYSRRIASCWASRYMGQLFHVDATSAEIAEDRIRSPSP